MARNARIKSVVTLVLIGVHPSIASDDEERTFNITSEPPGAHVVLNGRDRGITPLGIKVGHWAFDPQKSSMFSKHLSEPWTMEISKDGYRTESIEITRGPFSWHSFNGQHSYQYWVLNSPSYHVKLRPATRPLTNADVVSLLKSGLGEDLIIEKIRTSPCEFRTDPEDLKTLHEGGISDAIIATMMQAMPADQGGPVTAIQPTKK
jgi:hypothetical protein